MNHYIVIFGESGLLIATGLVALRYLYNRSWGKWKYDASLEGKVIIVTGANSGIGKSVSSQLAAKGAKVIMACRNEERAKAAIDDIRKSVKNGQLIYKHLDLEDLNSVKQCAHDISSSEEKIDILICNAGIYEAPYKMTIDGYESHFQVNHLGHAMLEVLLLPKLISTSSIDNPSKIVSVTSSLVANGYVSEIDFIKNSLRETAWSRTKAYPKTKLYSLLFNQELAKTLNTKPLKIFLASPGFVFTNLSRHRSIPLYQYILFAPIAFVYLRTAYQGAQSILEASFPSNEKNRNLPTGSVLRKCHLDVHLNNIGEKFPSKHVFDKTIDILASDSEVDKVLKILKIRK